MKNIQSKSDHPVSVLIAGIGGGSLGLEIFKSLRYATGYRLIGTDISERAYGLYEEGFQKTYLLRRSSAEDYARQLLQICLKEKINEDLKTAMKEKDAVKLQTVRSIRAMILEFEKICEEKNLFLIRT